MPSKSPAVEIGARIAQFEITARLGAGGMGEVYAARDANLGRSVALKLLPPAWSNDPERVARFEHEARMLAALNHANIAVLYGFERAAGKCLLVMELVPGETLAQRIERGPIPVADALPIAHQIAEALEAAHANGIVHRDLKPANVKITPEGRVKVLDFGLAKALTPTPSGPQDILSSPTVSFSPTQAGVILGTAPYMSPEQARGQATDARTDIFAFGCGLYEMLSGRRSFAGATVSDTIASVLAREPDFAALPANLHPRLAALLRRCLEKDLRRRWQAIGDVRLELEAVQADPAGLTALAAAAAPPRSLWRRAAGALLASTAAALVAAALAWSLHPAPLAAVTRFSFPLPPDQRFTRTGRHDLAISPDGSSIAYVANQQIFLRRLDAAVPVPLAGTNLDVNTPLFSPDGRELAFYLPTARTLDRIAVAGGAAITLATVGNPYGASWDAAGDILVGQGAQGIVRVSAHGGTPATVVTVGPGELAQSPQMLPDGDHVLFTLASGGNADRWDKAEIVAQSLQSGQRRVLLTGGSDARYVAAGYLVYALGPNLLAVPFNPGKLQVTGPPVPVLQGVRRANSNLTAAMQFAISSGGTLVSAPGITAPTVGSLELVSRSGTVQTLPPPPADYRDPRISPDGRQLAVTVLGGSSGSADIWVYALSGASAIRRLTLSGNNFASVWTPDSKRIVFTSLDQHGLFGQPSDGSGAPERLTTFAPGDRQFADAWTPDGKTLIYSGDGSGPASGIFGLTLSAAAAPQLLVRSSSPDDTPPGSASLSPDGHWLAYSQTASKHRDIWVQPFPSNGAKYQVSTTHNLFNVMPRWSPDGRQLYYVQGQPDLSVPLAAVAVSTLPAFTVGRPEVLPITLNTQRGYERDYDVTPDGRQFLIKATAPDNTPKQIDVVLNWFSVLRGSAGGQ